MKVSLADEAVTYDIANDMGRRVVSKGQYEEANAFFLSAFEGQRRVLGKEHKDTLDLLNNLGSLHGMIDLYEGAL